MECGDGSAGVSQTVNYLGLVVLRFFNPYVRGLCRSGASAAHVTRGIGAIGFQARIGAPPEISLLRPRKA